MLVGAIDQKVHRGENKEDDKSEIDLEVPGRKMEERERGPSSNFTPTNFSPSEPISSWKIAISLMGNGISVFGEKFVPLKGCQSSIFFLDDWSHWNSRARSSHQVSYFSCPKVPKNPKKKNISFSIFHIPSRKWAGKTEMLFRASMNRLMMWLLEIAVENGQKI